MSNGYIYLRDNAWYRTENAVKLGIASNIKDRASTYVTGEIVRGEFIRVFSVPHDKMRIVESCLHRFLSKFHIGDKGGGTEFFTRDIIDMVEPFLRSMSKLEFHSLTKEECDLLDRTARIRQALQKALPHGLRKAYLRKKNRKNIVLNSNTLTGTSLTSTSLTGTSLTGPALTVGAPLKPRDFQQEIINNCLSHFSREDKGILVLTCGVGKTLISLWVAKQLGSQKIVIGVPTIVLLEQWLPIIIQIFPDRPVYVKDENIELVSQTSACVVITTYASSFKLTNYAFDLKILDEAHHLTSKSADNYSDRAFVQMLNIVSTKQLALTATPKYLESDSMNTVSNDNEAQFGKIIHQICLLWAIQNAIVCDYVIQTIVVDEEKIDAVENKRLFLSAYCALKSIDNGHSHHLLIYCNEMTSSSIILQYICELLRKDFRHLQSATFCEEYNSKMSVDQQRAILKNFEESRFGIIVCVYCLGEGWNCPLLDAVVFAENMSSNIRILQCALRACRKDFVRPNKVAKLILPIVDADTEDQDLKKVREVIRQMGLEDETVISKLKVFTEDMERDVKQKPRNSASSLNDSFVYSEELTRRLRLKTVARDGYNFDNVKKLLQTKSVRSISEYLELCDRDTRFPRDPERAFRNQYTKWSWFHYFGISSSSFYDIVKCKTKCAEYLAAYPDIRSKYLDLSLVCTDLCKLDPQFPPNGMWVDYYEVNELRDLIQIAAPMLKKKGLGS